MTNGKQKGKRGELEFSRFCRERGYDTRRTAQFCGNTGQADDVIGLPGIHIEVKRVEKLNVQEAMQQAIHDSIPDKKIPIVAHRKNNCEWFVTMRAKDWFKLYREWDMNGGTEDEKAD